MANQYKNKVIFNGVTLIDLSDTTAVQSDVASGKSFYTASGQKVAGTKADEVLSTKTITLNGTYDPDDDNADGYSAVTVNVQNGASMTEVANTYGTELVITSAQSAAPSATRHTLYFEFEDTTTETEYAYYDDSFISSAITATTPTTRNNKTVTLAQLDGTTWYSYTPSTGTWETVLEDDVYILADTPYNGFWISDLGSEAITAGDTWRITIDGEAYTCVATLVNGNVWIGNPKYAEETDDGTNVPFCFRNQGYGAWSGGCDTRFTGEQTHPMKFEKLVST